MCHASWSLGVIEHILMRRRFLCHAHVDGTEVFACAHVCHAQEFLMYMKRGTFMCACMESVLRGESVFVQENKARMCHAPCVGYPMCS